MQVTAKSSSMRDDNVLPAQRSGRWVWVLLIAIVLAATTGGTIAVRQVTIGGLEARAAERLVLYQNSLFGQLKRFEYLPSILSSNEILKGLLETPETVRRERANGFLEQVVHPLDSGRTTHQWYFGMKALGSVTPHTPDVTAPPAI